MYLVDTSVWIDFLRGNSNDKVNLLEKLLEEGEAHLCEIIFAEICFGAKDSKQFKKYSDYFSELPFLSPSNDWYKQISKMGNTLRLKGHKPFIADLFIAYTALSHRVMLLTSDKDFNPYRDLFGLVLNT